MNRLSDLVKLIRPHQWIKNAFVVFPLVFTPAAVNSNVVTSMALAFACFCAVASAMYCLNDILDRNRDRLHPAKKNRPLAANNVSLSAAVIMLILLGGAGLVGSFSLNQDFAVIISFYILLNFSYSLVLKHISIVDVITIALGFVLRIYAGSAIIGQPPSIWIVVCTGLLAIFVALSKRRDDLHKSLGGDHRKSIDGYSLNFIDAAMMITTSALLVSYIVYTTNEDVIAKLHTENLFATIPMVIFGILRYLQITIVEQRSESPTLIILSDWRMIVAVGLWLITILYLIYG